YTEPTTLFAGYQFGLTDQTSKDSLTVGPFTSPSTRDSRSHYFYVGGIHNFTEKLNGTIRVGGQYTEYPNAPAGTSNDTISPYVDANVAYQYAAGSRAQIGIKHTRAQTDLAGLAGGVPTLDQELTTVYSSVDHQITGKLTGSVVAQFQNSEFNQGAANDLVDQIYVFGLSFAYQINQYLTAETGYNWDRLDSDLAGRSFSRHRLFLGIRASY
ncbi:MAG: outer membrane beta-barrel protein, partial [Verrucomicrobiota bacterium]